MLTTRFIHDSLARRMFLRRLALSAAFLTAPGAFAEALTATPKQTEGPFYPDHLPLDTDNDLLIINDAITAAVGEVTWLSGRVLDASGHPLCNTLVEIWQADHNGVYIHSLSGSAERRDGNFQGFGRFLTGSDGQYLFRTIKPVPYGGRTPHIHFKLKRGGRDILTTQCYIDGEPQNERDGIWKSLGSPERRALCTVPFTAVAKSKTGELAATFDLITGVTPEQA